ncbi:hypothetical protein FZEAL_8362 [Fusarium zealandicum]|uniref:Ars binding protein 2 n=1 Tax=Fusarium zealandicum TaxID=1053134 RepID=A0A8H4XHK8_9HYPO|nr:hypothetical protein FZEAL_8362 [Fusarium zealandicum]
MQSLNHPPPPPPPPPSGSSGPSPAGSATTPDIAVRPSLPDRNVTADTIEDAYVRFIFFCNPGLSPSIETVSLREAFRNPPRSGGKVFSTFAIYELVRKFYDNEIRTWTELTTRLGVEPPDPSKKDSAQKNSQYGVRLKKWMNSMHVKAFFEYLMDIANDYWTKIPPDSNPTSQPARDGVALEDDMALRALLPHIRPKRGRKRPVDEDTATYPAHRPHLAPVSATDDMRQGMNGPLSADPSRLSCMPWTPGEVVQHTLLSRWPQSAITPTTRNSFWDDALEPQSAVTPSKPKLTAQRRGPKNVSSAWRPGVSNGGAKPRGRPPSRTPVDASMPPFSPGTPATASGEPRTPIYPYAAPASAAPCTTESGPLPPPYAARAPSTAWQPQPQPQPQPQSTPPRAGRPSISLQVPDRPTGSVRLATPPPIVMVNGEHSDVQHAPTPPEPTSASAPTGSAQAADHATRPSHQQAEESTSRPKAVPKLYFERVKDRTNVDEVSGYMIRGCIEANWFDAEGKPSHGCSVQEAMGIVNAILEDMYNTAATPDAFLINLAAMAGGSHLVTAKARICRMGVEAGMMRYKCQWEYGFAHIRGVYQMDQLVPADMVGYAPSEGAAAAAADGTDVKLSADEWQAKYKGLLEEMKKKNKSFTDMQTRVVELLKGDVSKE